MGNAVLRLRDGSLNDFKSNKANDVNDLPERIIKVIRSTYEMAYWKTALNVSHQWVDDSMIPMLCDWVLKYEDRLMELNLAGNKITSKGASMLFDILSKKKSTLEKINLRSNEMDDKIITSLGEYVKSNEYIQYICIGDSHISDKGIEMLSSYLHGNTSLKGIDLSRCSLVTNSSVEWLLKAIQLSHIESVDVVKTSISRDNIFAASLAVNKIKNGSEELDLNERLYTIYIVNVNIINNEDYHRGITDEDISVICEGINQYETGKLSKLKIEWGKITSKGASLLFNTLKAKNLKLTEIDLIANQLNDECIESAGEYIQSNSSLQVLGLGNNISDVGIKNFSKYMFGNKAIKTLDIRGHKRITDDSVPYFADIAKRSYVRQINLQATAISDFKKEEITKLTIIKVGERDVNVSLEPSPSTPGEE